MTDVRLDGQEALGRINHFVVLYLENHSFDNMYGLFPGANGISRATPARVAARGEPSHR